MFGQELLMLIWLDHFFEESLTIERFVRFLIDDFPNLMEDIPLRYRVRMWLQLDSALPHFGRNTSLELNRKFPNKWIGRGGLALFPARFYPT